MEKAFSPPFSPSQIKPSCLRFPSTHTHPVFPVNSNFPINKSNAISWSFNVHITQKGSRLVAAVQTSSNESGSDSIEQPGPGNSPLTVGLQPILDESQFDQVVAEAEQVGESVVILWQASWCRKCIYLKPKLEKLAADYYPRVRFCSIDVNSVPHKLVVRAGVTKMPTIQLWRAGKKHSEVIGGHKAHLVVSEVRDMIESEDCS